MKKILILANDVTTILQFRCELITALVEAKNEVIVSVPDSERIAEIEALGAKVIKTQVARHGKNPLKDLKLIKDYKKLLKEINPDIVFTFTIKPNVYGGMACRKLKIPFVANVTGLGVVGKKGLLQTITLWLYKKGLRGAKCVFFQNSSNKEFFKQKKIVKGKTELLPGSGVNVQKFSYLEYPSSEEINIVFVGRIIKDKGVYELADAAKHIEARKDLKFTILGTCEYGSENPFDNLSNVNCLGYDKNVKPHLQKAHAIVLPSYHEGMANVLLEAASCGRPILASLVPGCKETFDEGVTGFGFQVKNSNDLIKVLEKFLNLSLEDKKQMGIKGRKKIEREFDRALVINKYFNQL